MLVVNTVFNWLWPREEVNSEHNLQLIVTVRDEQRQQLNVTERDEGNSEHSLQLIVTERDEQRQQLTVTEWSR